MIFVLNTLAGKRMHLESILPNEERPTRRATTKSAPHLCPPSDAEVCALLWLGLYLLMFKRTDDHPQLFPDNNHFGRFSKMLRRILASDVASPQLAQRRVDPDYFGPHSILQGAVTYAASGSTACPPATAVKLWTVCNEVRAHRKKSATQLSPNE